MHDPGGRAIDDRRIEELANHVGISLRTGCFCNPGAGEIAHHLGEREMRTFFEREEPTSFLELRDQLLEELDLLVGAIRVSVGLATNFRDVHQLMCFMQGFVDQMVDDERGST